MDWLTRLCMEFYFVKQIDQTSILGILPIYRHMDQIKPVCLKVLSWQTYKWIDQRLLLCDCTRIARSAKTQHSYVHYHWLHEYCNTQTSGSVCQTTKVHPSMYRPYMHTRSLRKTTHQHWYSLCLPFLFVFSIGLPLLCIILNANQRTKNGEAWDRGYKPQTSTVSVTTNCFLLRMFSCCLHTRPGVCGCLATSTPSNDISIKQEDVEAFLITSGFGLIGQRTKNDEAWDRGYKPQTSTVSGTTNCFLLRMFSCCLHTRPGVCGCLATSTPSNDISIKQEDVEAFLNLSSNY